MPRKKVRHVGSSGNWSQIAAFLITDNGPYGTKVWRRESPNGQIRFCCPHHGNNLNVELQCEEGYYELGGCVYRSSKPVDIKVPKPEPKFEMTHHCPSCGRKFNISSRRKHPLEYSETIEEVHVLS